MLYRIFRIIGAFVGALFGIIIGNAFTNGVGFSNVVIPGLIVLAGLFIGIFVGANIAGYLYGRFIGPPL